MQLKTKTKIRIGYGVFGIGVGLSVLIVFGVKFHNWSAGGWGLMSALFAALTLVLHIKWLQNQWRIDHGWLRPFFALGVIGQILAVAGFITYITLAATKHQSLSVRGHGYYITAVWCFMTWKWAFMNCYFSYKYQKLFQESAAYQPL